MNKVSKNQKGFSFIELILVIAVVTLIGAAGYLVYKNHHKTITPTTLRAATLQYVQINARDSRRGADIHYLQTLLEEFFSQNNYYPSRTDMNNATWLSKNMVSLDSGALADPSNTKSKILTASPVAKSYAYAPLNASGKSCETNDSACVTYNLTATYEGLDVYGNKTYSVKNNNPT